MSNTPSISLPVGDGMNTAPPPANPPNGRDPTFQIIVLALCTVAVGVCAAVATQGWLLQLNFFSTVPTETAEEGRIILWIVAGVLLLIAVAAWLLGRSKPAATIVAAHAVLTFLHATLWLFTAGPVIIALLVIIGIRLSRRAQSQKYP